MWSDTGWCYDTEEADAYIDWQTALIRDLLSDHQRMYPHHEDLCELCKRAKAALAEK